MTNQDTSIPGFIRIVERAGIAALEWSPLPDEDQMMILYFFLTRTG
uniref:Uncharacterized protein n=1 Tax=Oryzias sinensis TaxID=183150 RepID=A0A8C7Y842_9TELE